MVDDQKYFRSIFLCSVVTLLINDLFLKEYFHNYVTGKLSDFVGLFAFPYFISLFFPKKTKVIYILTGISFIFWKSELSQPIVDLFASFKIEINRTVDSSDLIALIVLPFSYHYYHSFEYPKIKTNLNFKPIIISICCFAFTATSYQREFGEIKLKSNLEIQLQSTEQEIVSNLNLISINGDDTFYCKTKIEDVGAEITSKIILSKGDSGLIKIKLDSINDFIIRGSLFSPADENDIKYIKSLKPQDFEKLYLEQEFIKLYQK